MGTTDQRSPRVPPSAGARPHTWARALHIVGAVLLALLIPRLALATSLAGSGLRVPSVSSSSSGPAGTSEAKEEEEAPDSPRASFTNYWDLCTRARYAEAARYLDVPRGADKRAEELARKLYVVLSERLWVDPAELSPQSAGRKDDGLAAGTEELGKVTDAQNRSVPIRIVRHESRSPEDEPRWVFSQSTVQAVDGLYASLRGRWVRDRLPPILLGQGWWALYYWQWLSFPVLAAICLLAGRFLAWVAGLVNARLLAHMTWGAQLVQRMSRPITLLWAVLLFWLLVPYLALTVRAEEVIDRLLRALGYLALFWMLLRAVAVAGDEMNRAAWTASKPGLRSLASVGTKLGRVIVAVLALMVALSELGYPVTSVVAGLGIGGVALALAAQKTVENLFGSVSILVDQPFIVGDTIKVDGVEGSVESIGLRSSRIRTADRTLIILPNGKLADMRIESLGPRDRIRFSTKLPLATDTTAQQVKAIVEGIRTALGGHDRVIKSDIYVQLSSVGDASFDVEVATMVDTRDFGQFAKIREDLLLACIAVVHAQGARLAVRKIMSLTAGGEHEHAREG